MLVPHDKLVTATFREYLRMQPSLVTSGIQASAGVALGHALNLLATRTSGGIAALDHRRQALCAAIDAVLASASPSAAASRLATLARSVATGLHGSLSESEATLRSAMGQFEACVAELVDADDIADKSSLAIHLADWEAADLMAQVSLAEAEDGAGFAITGALLEAYLRDRFGEPGLAVTAFAPLPGGFGKETILFSVTGKALNGDFVMRRDPGSNDSLTNDCHEVFREYPLIRAAHARGFPAPEALWLDTEHALLPGGDFIVMHKSPGVMGGDIFGASGTVPPRLAEALGEIAARLHTLEPLLELGELASFIAPPLWDLSREEAARRYIAGWYEYYRAEVHTPSPALCTIFGWLLDNVPARAGPAALLHGDFGFHNFLFDDQRLSAVLDWEFAHVGDPAEELGYIAMATEGAMDWDAFMQTYRANGGDDVDAATLRFFKIWAHIRNAAAGNVLSTRFTEGPVEDIKLTILPFHHFPRFIGEASRLIAEAEAERKAALTA
jgi:aminoglycoside phosphotransferase (APT) family kinase protein